MTTIDHAAEARRHKGYALTATHGGKFEEAGLELGAAQVHATLALVEQQRIANLVALAGRNVTLDEELSLLGDEAAHRLMSITPTPATPSEGPDETIDFRADIKKALGL